MKPCTLKPFGDWKYISVEDALRELEGLPDFVADAAKRDAKPAEENLPQDENHIVDLEGRLIDSNPSGNGNNKNQDAWISYFNGRNEIMASMPDIYLAGKSNNKALIKSLRDDFKASWVISSTRIIYNETDLYGKIVHYYGSNFAKPIEFGRIYVPVYEGVVLNDALDDKDGLFYLQALFGTRDDAGAIRQTLKNLGGYNSSNTKVWTSSQAGRKNWPQRAAGFYYGLGVFRVDGDGLSYDGRSRGVRVSPR